MSAKVCRWWWDEEGEDFMTSCREVFPAQRKRCPICGEAVQVVKSREALEAPESQPHTVHPWDALEAIRASLASDSGSGLSARRIVSEIKAAVEKLPLGVRP